MDTLAQNFTWFHIATLIILAGTFISLAGCRCDCNCAKEK